MAAHTWRYVVYKTQAQTDSLSPCGVVVALGEVERYTLVELYFQHSRGAACPVKSGTPAVKVWTDPEALHVCKAFRSDANGYADIGRLTLGRNLYSVDGW